MIGLDVILAKPDGKGQRNSAATDDTSKGQEAGKAERSDDWMAALTGETGGDTAKPENAEASQAVPEEAVTPETFTLRQDLLVVDDQAGQEGLIETAQPEIAPEAAVEIDPALPTAAPQVEAGNPVTEEGGQTPAPTIAEIAQGAAAETGDQTGKAALAAPDQAAVKGAATAQPVTPMNAPQATAPAEAASLLPQTAAMRTARAEAALGSGAPARAETEPSGRSTQNAPVAQTPAAAQTPGLQPHAATPQGAPIEAPLEAEEPEIAVEEAAPVEKRLSGETLAEVRRIYSAALLTPSDRPAIAAQSAPAQQSPLAPEFGALDSSPLEPTAAERVESAAIARGAGPADARPAFLALTQAQSAPQAAAITSQIRVALAATDGGRIDIQLDPPELGRLSVTILARDDVSSATVSAERSEVIDLLRRNADMLARDLAEAGFENLTLDFASSEENAETDEETAAGPMDLIGETVETSATAPIRQGLIADRLDIRL